MGYGSQAGTSVYRCAKILWPTVAETPSLSNSTKRASASYPREKESAFTMVCATRQGSGMSSLIHVAAISWNPTSGWDDRWIGLPMSSDLITALGTGVDSIRKRCSRWRKVQKLNQGKTSLVVSAPARAATLSWFMDCFLMDPVDPYTPTLVAVRRTRASVDWIGALGRNPCIR
jgi:hypothetical protein